MLTFLNGGSGGGGGGGSSGSSYVVYNVQTYGADPTNGSSSTTAIQAAITAALVNSASGRGSVIYFPKGEYKISTGISIPRVGWLGTGTISFVGDGVNNTSLSDSGTLAPGTPLISIASTPTGTSAAYMNFSNMSLTRSSNGQIFVHTQPTSDPVNERLIRCTFKNLYIRGKTTAGTSTLLDIVGGIECMFENVWMDGGAVAARFKDSSHMFAFGFGTTTDTYCVAGLLIDGGGNHVLNGIRIEGTSGGYGVKFTGSTKNINVNGLTFEGKLTTPQVDFDDCQNIVVLNPAIASPSAASIIGLKFRATAYANTVLSGNFSDFTGQASAYAVQIDSNSRNNEIKGGYYSGGVVANVNLSATCQRCFVSGFEGGVAASPNQVAAGMFSSILATPAAVNEFEYYNVSYVGAGNLDNLTGGYIGQIVKLFFTNGNCTVRHNAGGTGNIFLSGAANFTGTTNDTMQLLYNGTNWYQLSTAVI